MVLFIITIRVAYKHIYMHAYVCIRTALSLDTAVILLIWAHFVSVSVLIDASLSFSFYFWISLSLQLFFYFPSQSFCFMHDLKIICTHKFCFRSRNNENHYHEFSLSRAVREMVIVYCLHVAFYFYAWTHVQSWNGQLQCLRQQNSDRFYI